MRPGPNNEYGGGPGRGFGGPGGGFNGNRSGGKPLLLLRLKKPPPGPPKPRPGPPKPPQPPGFSYKSLGFSYKSRADPRKILSHFPS